MSCKNTSENHFNADLKLGLGLVLEFGMELELELGIVLGSELRLGIWKSAAAQLFCNIYLRTIEICVISACLIVHENKDNKKKTQLG